MIYIYDYNSHELVGQFKSAGKTALDMGLKYAQYVFYHLDKMIDGHRSPVIHRKKGIAVYITCKKNPSLPVEK